MDFQEKCPARDPKKRDKSKRWDRDNFVGTKSKHIIPPIALFHSYKNCSDRDGFNTHECNEDIVQQPTGDETFTLGLTFGSAGTEGVVFDGGVYDFTHPRGSFEVHLRPGGRFFAPMFPAKTLWMCTAGPTGQLLIQWAQYGQYALSMDASSPIPSFTGSVVGRSEDWRKVFATIHARAEKIFARHPITNACAHVLIWQMKWRRPFTLPELKLMDSEWELEHPGGSFAIEFRADGTNSCACPRLNNMYNMYMCNMCSMYNMHMYNMYMLHVHVDDLAL